MEWINAKQYSPPERGHYWVITKPLKAKWHKRYMVRMFYGEGLWHREWHQSNPIWWAYNPILPGPIK